MSETLDSEYEEIAIHLEPLKDDLERLLRGLLQEAHVRFHDVTCRVKSKESALRKLQGSAGERPLASLTDMLGIRIITYFRDDVDIIAKIIEKEFAIDVENSVDKRAILDPDRFGYLSLHYIASLTPHRASLTENRKYCDDKFEIQIRSILQHAWAEIEHDLGYKSQAAVPRNVRRRFSRLAGLLEVVDEEFFSIREELAAHQANTSTLVNSGAWEVEIDQDSLCSLVETSDYIEDLDHALANSMTGGILVRKVKRDYIGKQAERLTLLEFCSISDLNAYLHEHERLLKRFARKLLDITAQPSRGAMGRAVPRGVTFYYMCLLKYAQCLLSDKIYEGITFENVSDTSLAQALRAAMREHEGRIH